MTSKLRRWYNTTMTIKKIKPVKPASAPAAAAPAAAPAAPAAGGATIADRFKLDVPATPAKSGGGGTVGKKAAMIALVVGLVALTVAGILAFVLYQHWDYLCNQVA